MRCSDCVHYDSCKRAIKLHTKLMDNKYRFGMDETKPCELFKPKSRFVELPCEVGTWLWVVRKDYVSESFRVDAFDDRNLVMFMQDAEWNLSITYKGIKIWRVSFEDFGKTVFLSREEAENALSERSK